LCCTEPMERCPMDGGNDDNWGFPCYAYWGIPVRPLLPHMDKSEVLGAGETYHMVVPTNTSAANKIDRET
jgi:hypothetical protein